MLWIAAAAIAATVPPPVSHRSGATAQARAMVRIVSAVRLRLDGGPNADAPRPRETIIRTALGEQPAKLIEFQ
jgi:hypothetical protein